MHDQVFHSKATISEILCTPTTYIFIFLVILTLTVCRERIGYIPVGYYKYIRKNKASKGRHIDYTSSRVLFLRVLFLSCPLQGIITTVNVIVVLR